MSGKRKSKAQLTPLELRIMQVLWTAGPSNVQAVQAGLKEELAYTTVQTMLNVLERKGHVKRRLVGRAYEYRPLQTREVAQGSAVSDLLNRLFDGSAEDLVMNMVRSKQVDGAKLAELARKISIAEEEAYADSE